MLRISVATAVSLLPNSIVADVPSLLHILRSGDVVSLGVYVWTDVRALARGTLKTGIVSFSNTDLG